VKGMKERKRLAALALIMILNSLIVGGVAIVEFEWDGKTVRLASIRGITERRQAEVPLHESQATFLTVLDSIDATIHVADMETYEILFMNKHMIDNFGTDFTGKICWESFRHESGPFDHCTNDKLLDEEGNPAGVQVWNDQNPVTEKWYINYDRAIKWSDGHYVRSQVATALTRQLR
jgi:two-component system, cell cycle sensor histidine kinase and response regulator CckA